MEYTFTDSSGFTQRVELEEYGFTITGENRRRSVSYAHVIEIRMCRRSRGRYRMMILTEDEGTIVVCSTSRTPQGEWIDQSRPYALFARVLHHHLRDKSKAAFTCGGTRDGLWRTVACTLVLALVLSVGLNTSGLSLLNPYLQAGALAAMFFVSGIMIRMIELPKSYPPADIPLQFLP